MLARCCFWNATNCRSNPFVTKQKTKQKTWATGTVMEDMNDRRRHERNANNAGILDFDTSDTADIKVELDDSLRDTNGEAKTGDGVIVYTES